MRFADLIGKVVGGRYQIGSLIGSGGVSSIFEALDTSTQKKVAIKVIATTVTETQMKRFEREAALVANMDHPNICQLYSYWLDDDDIPFMAMELISGLNISQLIVKHGKMDLDFAVWIMDQVCEALEYAHGNGVLHRDLKPANIMIEKPGTANERVKVLDFGMAKNIDDPATKLTKTGFVPGTPGFMSPEQLMGRTVDFRSDLYSLACTLHLMLTGREVFKHKNPILMSKMHVEDTPVLTTDDVEYPLIPFFRIALQKDPTDRFQSATEFREGLTLATKNLI